MAKDPIKKAGKRNPIISGQTWGYDSVTGKQIQKYRSGFSTKKEARTEYSDWCWRAEEGLAMKRNSPRLSSTLRKFIFMV